MNKEVEASLKEAKNYADKNGYWCAEEEERLVHVSEEEDDEWVIVRNVEDIECNTSYNIVDRLKLA